MLQHNTHISSDFQGQNNSAHPNFTAGTLALKKPHYTVPEGQKTIGEKLYSFNNYFTVGYAANLALSVAVTEYFMERGGKHVFNSLNKCLSSGLSQTMSPKAATSISKAATKYSLLTMGGTILMLPMIWAENNKSKIVYLTNRTIAPATIANDDSCKDVTATKILGKDFDENLLPQPVTEQPKQSVTRGSLRRLFSIGVIVSWATLLDRTIGEDFFEKLGMKELKKAESVPGVANFNKLVEKSPEINRWTRWTFTDIVNTIITTGVIWKTNGADKHKNLEVEPASEEPYNTSKPDDHYQQTTQAQTPDNEVLNASISNNKLSEQSVSSGQQMA